MNDEKTQKLYYFRKILPNSWHNVYINFEVPLNRISEGRHASARVRIKKIVLDIVIFLGISSLIVIAVNTLNMVYFWRLESIGRGYSYFSQNDLLLLEGLLFVFGGFLLLLGSGGISWWTILVVLRGSARDWLRGEESEKRRVQPSKVFDQDRWRGKGFVRAALISIFSGILMVYLYFANL